MVMELNKTIQDLKLEVDTIKKTQSETTLEIENLGKRLDLEGIILSEVTQSQKNSNDMYSLISGY